MIAQRKSRAGATSARIINLQAEDGTGPILTVRVVSENMGGWRAEIIEAQIAPLDFPRAAWREVTLAGNPVR